MEEKHRLLRKYSNTLVICGMGEVVYGVWSVIRTILAVILSMNITDLLIAEAEANGEVITESDLELLKVLFYISLGILLAGELLLRMYVGISSRAEGLGRKKNVTYIIAAGIIVINHLSTLWTLSVGLHNANEDLLDNAVMIVIDLTSVLILIDLIICAVKVRKLRREIQAETAEG
ncbi:MAG: hypothetical protein IJ251_06405 [Oscillospiraceae bacterium]|nr:hypothetical protein [Oscillospiraceae bacterium]